MIGRRKKRKNQPARPEVIAELKRRYQQRGDGSLYSNQEIAEIIDEYLGVTPTDSLPKREFVPDPNDLDPPAEFHTRAILLQTEKDRVVRELSVEDMISRLTASVIELESTEGRQLVNQLTKKLEAELGYDDDETKAA